MTSTERRTALGLAGVYGFRMLGLFLILPVFALFAEDLPGSTPFLTGLAIGIYGLTQALLQIPFGMLSDRIGRKTVILGGLPDIMNILLQVMDGAKLTDNNGVVSDFKNVILIMTSNIGTKEPNVMGFTKDTTMKTDKALAAFFSPEFRNRLSATIEFKPLKMDALVQIVDIEADKLNDLLKAKKVKVKLTGKAKEYLAEEGYDERYGARHIARVIDEKVKEALTDEILFGRLKKGGKVKVDFKEGQLQFEYEER